MLTPITLWILLATTVALIAYDIFAAAKWGSNYTISVNIWNVSLKYPFVPFLFGLLMGHLFTQMNC